MQKDKKNKVREREEEGERVNRHLLRGSGEYKKKE